MQNMDQRTEQFNRVKELGSTKIPRCAGSSHSWSDSQNESEKTRECSLTAVITGVTAVAEAVVERLIPFCMKVAVVERLIPFCMMLPSGSEPFTVLARGSIRDLP